MAVSQVKLSSLATSVAFIFLLLSFWNQLEERSHPWLVQVGGYSFGIYLIHMFFLGYFPKVISRVPFLSSMPPFIQSVGVFFGLLTLCSGVIFISRKVLGEHRSVGILGL